MSEMEKTGRKVSLEDLMTGEVPLFVIRGAGAEQFKVEAPGMDANDPAEIRNTLSDMHGLGILAAALATADCAIRMNTAECTHRACVVRALGMMLIEFAGQLEKEEGATHHPAPIGKRAH